MKEAIYQCTPYIGVGKVKEALDAVHDVFVENQIELPLEDQSTVCLLYTSNVFTFFTEWL